jgi:ADP-heptose:LPS heptosyltransferase
LISTSCKEIAQALLERCIAGQPPRELPRALLADGCGRALFGVLVEGLADRFEPPLCDAYARLFSQAIAYVDSRWEAPLLVARYERVRKVRPVSTRPRRVFVLSRVTLGADVAVTSVVLAAAKRRFPHAEITFVAPRKNYELFAADRHIHHAPLEYRRGTLRDRLAVWDELTALLSDPGCIVLDPDSRLTQLGLLPVSAEDRYHLFESRSYGNDTAGNLSELAAAWAAETLGAPGVKPYLALGPAPEQAAPYIAVSLGVGENPAKRLPDPFEKELLEVLGASGMPLCVDTGPGGEEAGRVRRALAESGVNATTWEGSFAGFASIIASAKLYVGYDSSGQHVAAACGIPLITIFAGFPVPRMFDRWRPSGEKTTVIRVDRPDADEVLGRVREALSAHAARAAG